MTFNDVFRMFWTPDEDPARWRYKRRSTILGKWHQIKMSWWKEHVDSLCVEMGLPAEEYMDPPAFDLGEAFYPSMQLDDFDAAPF